MANDVSFTNGKFELTLNFIEVDSSDYGPRVYIEVEYASSFQTLKWTIDQL